MKELFDSTHRLGRRRKIDFKYGFLAMYTFDQDKRKNKTFEFAEARNWSSAEQIGVLVEEMDGATMRCHLCHRFKSILCGDHWAYMIPMNATVLITGEDDMQDPALIITIEDDFSNILI
jgi:hypothetical protein